MSTKVAKQTDVSDHGIILSPEDLQQIRDLHPDEKGIVVQKPNPVGIGVDCHSRFIVVTVLVTVDSDCVSYQREFSTDWDSLCLAKKWILWILSTFPKPALEQIEPISYVLESSANYHTPVIMCWGGKPCVINPVLAGATVRKSDTVDSARLALHSMDGIWRASYISPAEVKEIRVMLAQRDSFHTLAVRANNRIGSTMVRFGFTFGSEGSVTKNKEVRALVEDLISEHPNSHENICPYPLPDTVKAALRDEYIRFDEYTKQAQFYSDEVMRLVTAFNWETGEGTLPGDMMIKLLCTCPGIGPKTACVWLANIITPRRFPNSKACSAYCGLDPSVQISAKKVTGKFIRKGNADLHTALTQAASVLMKNRTEMFGKWAYGIYLQTGRWKKGTNALARKLSVALYHMQNSGQEFSYDKYNLLREVVVLDIPIDELPLLNPGFKRYIRIFKEHNILTTPQLATAYYTYACANMKGVGKTFYTLMKDFIDHQKDYRNKYKSLKEGDQHAENSKD